MITSQEENQIICLPKQHKTQRSIGVFLLVLGILMLAQQVEAVTEEIILRIDFTHQPDGDAIPWLKRQRFDFRLDAEKLNPYFEDHQLVLDTPGEEAGLIIRKLRIIGAKRIRITWGVDRYPQGANWAKGIFRVPIAVMISFGEEKISSGSFFVPNSPYFIGLFLGEKEQEGRAYTGKYYHKGGRYFCTPCPSPVGKTVTTEFNLDEAFNQQFHISPTPPISSFGFQMNTKDTGDGARAFLKSVEFLAD
jgi:hypothetical protein